jgi:hypothetical protein
MTTKPKRIGVTVDALIQRLNRRLARDGWTIRGQAGRGDRTKTGDRFITDGRGVIETHVTVKRLEEIAREKGALAYWEEVEA